MTRGMDLSLPPMTPERAQWLLKDRHGVLDVVRAYNAGRLDDAGDIERELLRALRVHGYTTRIVQPLPLFLSRCLEGRLPDDDCVRAAFGWFVRCHTGETGTVTVTGLMEERAREAWRCADVLPLRDVLRAQIKELDPVRERALHGGPFGNLAAWADQFPYRLMGSEETLNRMLQEPDFWPWLDHTFNGDEDFCVLGRELWEDPSTAGGAFCIPLEGPELLPPDCTPLAILYTMGPARLRRAPSGRYQFRW